MLSASLLRPSVVGGLLALRTYLDENPGIELSDAIKALSVSYTYSGFDFDSALLLHPLIPHLSSNVEAAFQTVISHILIAANPPWIGLLKGGREPLYRGVSLDIRACFERAGAFLPIPSADTIKWLDGIIAHAYSETEASRLFAGRDAERRSYELERDRIGPSLAGAIEWTSLNDNSVGYDIRSVQSSVDDTPKYIEVKSSRYNPVTIFITRNEWLAAERFLPNYFFHIWCTTENQFREFDAREIASHVPENRGDGEWQKVAIKLQV